MRGFKHVKAEFADAFEAGESIRVGTFEYYRSQEGERADPLEGLAVSAPGPFVANFGPPSSIPVEQMRAIHSMGISTEGYLNNVLFVGNFAVREVPAAYLFCCSAEPDQSCVEQGQVVFEITGLKSFARALSDAHRGLLAAPIVGRVLYEERYVDTLRTEAPRVDPFRKSAACAQEKEIRILWQPAQLGNELSPFQDLRCPAAAQLIRRVSN